MIRPALLAGLLLSSCATIRPSVVGERFDPPLPRLGGGAFSWQETRGQVTVVDVWASWCRSCAESLPFMAGLQHELPAFRYVGVTVDADARLARAFAETHAAGQLTVLHDRSAAYVAAHLPVDRLPLRLFIDRRGTVRAVQQGFIAGQIRPQIEALLSEPPPAAR